MMSNEHINNSESDNDLEIFYNNFKHLILGCKTKEDALHFLNKHKLDSTKYNFILSIIDGKKYHNVFDNLTVIKYINELIECKNNAEIYLLLHKLINLTNDPAQIKTFTRVANYNSNSKSKYSLLSSDIVLKKLLTKLCPHCYHEHSASSNTVYVICGYNGLTYDGKGCGCDWCFKCGKMLCKNWTKNNLHIPSNRFHDFKCCKSHSLINNKSYPLSYCDCNHSFVKRI